LVTPDVIPDQILIKLTIDDVEDLWMRIDTASPGTSMPSAQFAETGLSPGVHDVWIGSKRAGIHAGKRSLADVEAIGTGPLSDLPGVPPGTVLRGTAGTDLWEGFDIGIDFRGKELWLVPSKGTLDAATFPHPDGVGAPVSIVAERATGEANEGAALFLSASFDRGGASASFLLDTGTNTNIALGSYWQRVHPASQRSVPFDLADFEGKPLVGTYRMGSAYDLSGQHVGDREPVWVTDRFPVLEVEGQHFHHPIEGILGLWALYDHYAVLDFGIGVSTQTPRILLFPYTTATPSLEDMNFTGFGLVVADETMRVRVVRGSSADAQGVRDGDVLVTASGGALSFASSGVVRGGMGERRTFTMSRNGQTSPFLLTAGRLLTP
jgi:hypothetical protein